VLDIDHRADIYRRSLRLVGGPEVRLPGLSVPFTLSPPTCRCCRPR
jgi:hypothetical protein